MRSIVNIRPIIKIKKKCVRDITYAFLISFHEIRMAKTLFHFLLIILISTFPFLHYSLKAQDPHLSQYESSPQYLNPSMTGMFDGDYRINIHHRSQWRSIATKPFNSSAIAFDMPFKKMKIGAFALNNRAGAGSYNVLNFLLSAAYEQPFKKNPDHHLSMGFQAGLIHKTVNMDKLFFSTQYNSSNGGSFTSDISSGETFANTSIILPEANFGLMYFYSNTRKRINPFIGFSAFHLTEPRESFFGIDNRLPRRYILHAGTKINIDEKLQFVFHSLGMQQTNSRELINSILVNYYLPSSDIFLLAGVTYRNKDAAIAHLGLKYLNYTYRFSYDINTSILNAISDGKGGFELSIVYIMKKPIPNPVVACPRL